ncbi:MAG TPA: hypothetical protein VG929_09340 [Actinomycetota bacterium]|nr:hypothetical protein [Actinomycetota bacterium]
MKKAFLIAAAAAVMIGAGVAAPAAGSAAAASENMKKVADLDVGWVSEIAFDGRWAYAFGDQLSIIDRRTMEVVSTLKCGKKVFGGTEVEIVKRGVVAIDGYGVCGMEWGVFFVDVRDPRQPRIIGKADGTRPHTMTAYPGKPYIYSSPNGCCSDFAGGIERIIDASNPRNPKVVEFRSRGLGCHDVAFVIRKDLKLAGCAAGSETQLWDVSDPLKPVTVARIPTPTQFNHSAGFSDDGKILVVGDEAHPVNSCAGTPTGALWFYDISKPMSPVLKSYYNIDRGATVSTFWATYDTWCTAHMYDFKPNTSLLAAGWFHGGVNVLDLSDLANPKEVGYYISSDFKPWAAYWADGLIWTSDYGKKGGVEVFELGSGGR